ncbi:MAG: hypothetical protein P8178_15395 [Candidatus Thiodiazotropha sp.]
MGMLDKLFGGGHDYPPLPAENQAMKALDEVHDELEALTQRVREKLEIVPDEHAAFVFMGKPPKRFGIAWIHEGRVSSLKELAEENNLTPAMIDHLVDALREAYTHASEAPRYTTHIGRKDVVVIPSDSLKNEVHHIIEETIH